MGLCLIHPVDFTVGMHVIFSRSSGLPARTMRILEFSGSKSRHTRDDLFQFIEKAQRNRLLFNLPSQRTTWQSLKYRSVSSNERCALVALFAGCCCLIECNNSAWDKEKLFELQFS
ncbi:hypothetical protein BO78DRAFT_210858 [Aspergillus sclerotiicarbonarius CBS 121057]|uniref:Uncharacterized protein n=1 Tax=Aspergillus sclerotiicarbonarius (strain CBS 121057 / IBT 28362) TaxID=1448318 RepID=A0A319E0E1_ASPSB|nr:hypothetical protein BO78DRAFT_210858 [Aspergillus sclerotiicarbonarius CBS 121057]